MRICLHNGNVTGKVVDGLRRMADDRGRRAGDKSEAQNPTRILKLANDLCRETLIRAMVLRTRQFRTFETNNIILKVAFCVKKNRIP